MALYFWVCVEQNVYVEKNKISRNSKNLETRFYFSRTIQEQVQALVFQIKTEVQWFLKGEEEKKGQRSVPSVNEEKTT